MTQQLTPFEATHPGEILKDELAARHIKQRDFAYEIDVKPSYLNEVIKKKRPVTADLAIVLEKSLAIPADFWLRFQRQYEIDRARLKEKNQVRIRNIEYWKMIKNIVPIKDLQKSGYLKGTLEENINQIKKIYGVSSIEELEKSLLNQ